MEKGISSRMEDEKASIQDGNYRNQEEPQVNFSEGFAEWQSVCETIENYVDAFCQEHKIKRCFPVDIEEIARIRNLKVVYTDLNPIEAGNTFAIVGKTFEWSTDNEYFPTLVTIDKNQDRNSQRYALAYEIGISMLSEVLGDNDVPKSYNYSVPILPMSSTKFLAEVYAMCLLLPWKSILNALDEYVKDECHASPIDNIEWIDYLADCAKMPRYNLCIGFSYVSKIICRKCSQKRELVEKYRKILQP